MAPGEVHAGAVRALRVRWSIVFALILIAFGATVIVLNSTLYSASGFVSSYLSALERRDISDLLATPGVAPPDDAGRDLLTAEGLGDLGGIRIVSDTTGSDGRHAVEVAVLLGDTTTTTTLEVEREGSRFGMFARWAFSTSPTAVLAVTPVNDPAFDANGVPVTATAAGAPVALAVLVPSVVTLSHESAYLVAEPEDLLMVEAQATTTASVTQAANPDFVALVQDELNGVLDDCATQQVLQPTGCPFGKTIDNRIDGLPTWSIVRYPVVSIRPTATPGTWEVPTTDGTAHVSVAVQSLFDGTESVLEDDVLYAVSYLITFPGDGSVSIVAQ